MIYINKIDEVPTTAEIIFPLNRDIVLVYTDIIDGGDAYNEEGNGIDGGDASSIYTQTIDGGDAFNTGSKSFDSSHTLLLRHTATNTSYKMKCKVIEKTRLFITVELLIEEKMWRGQYVMTLTDNETNEVLYRDLLQIGGRPDELNEYKNQINLTQYER